MMIFAFLLMAISVIAQNSAWKIVPGRITTPWADSVNLVNVLHEYPRPQMQRNDWVNLRHEDISLESEKHTRIKSLQKK